MNLVVNMSRAVFMAILSEMHVWLSEIEAEELYQIPGSSDILSVFVLYFLDFSAYFPALFA